MLKGAFTMISWPPSRPESTHRQPWQLLQHNPCIPGTHFYQPWKDGKLSKTFSGKDNHPKYSTIDQARATAPNTSGFLVVMVMMVVCDDDGDGWWFIVVVVGDGGHSGMDDHCLWVSIINIVGSHYCYFRTTICDNDLEQHFNICMFSKLNYHDYNYDSRYLHVL